MSDYEENSSFVVPHNTSAEMKHEPITKEKLDYLQLKYIFRFPFTLTAMKWGFVMGGFFGIHSFVKNRNFFKAFRVWMGASVLLTLSTLLLYMVKYSYYQNSITAYEAQNLYLNQTSRFLRKITELRLKVPSNNELSDDELKDLLLRTYEEKKRMHRDFDQLIIGINNHTFDMH